MYDINSSVTGIISKPLSNKVLYNKGAGIKFGLYIWNTLQGLLYSSIFIIASAHKSTGVNSRACFKVSFGKAPISINDFSLLTKALSLIFFWNIPSEYLLVILPILTIWTSNPSSIASKTEISALYLVVL